MEKQKSIAIIKSEPCLSPYVANHSWNAQNRFGASGCEEIIQLNKTMTFYAMKISSSPVK